MPKQTAVEWLINEIESKGEAWENASIRRVQISIDVSEYLELKRQAKEMEEVQKKELIVKAWQDGFDTGNYISTTTGGWNGGGEEYYNQTYTKE